MERENKNQKKDYQFYSKTFILSSHFFFYSLSPLNLFVALTIYGSLCFIFFFPCCHGSKSNQHSPALPPLFSQSHFDSRVAAERERGREQIPGSLRLTTLQASNIGTERTAT